MAADPAVIRPETLLGLGVISMVAGLALGWGCLALANAGPSPWGQAGHVVAERAFPWVLAAFAIGALVATIVRRPAIARGPANPAPRPFLTTPAGRHVLALAAAAAVLTLVVATVAYYGTGRFGDLSAMPVRRTMGWSVISVFIGTVFGAAGATVVVARRDLVGVLAVVALTATVAGEAVMVIVWGADGDQIGARVITLTTLALCALAPVVLPGRDRLAALAATGVLAVPAAVLIGRVLMYTGNL